MGIGDTQTSVANRALSSIGNRSTIGSLSEVSNESIQAGLWYGPARDELLRMAPWDCGFNYINLKGITATPGTPENTQAAPPFWNKTLPPPPWAYEYSYPADCLRACFVVPQFMSGFANGVPITTAITGGAPSFWNGPPARFKVAVDQPVTATTLTLASVGHGYAVNDTISLDPTNGTGVFPIFRVTQVDASGGITGLFPILSGSYLTPPVNPVAQGSTSGSGQGALFNLVLTAGVDRKVILTNQEAAILAYVKEVTDVTVWDSQFTEAFVHLLGARLVYALTGDKALANERIKNANEMIIRARNTDANEGLTVNDVTPDWIRTRGLVYPTDFGWSPNVGFDWGQLLTLY